MEYRLVRPMRSDGRLFGTLPIFAGGVLNTIAVSIAIAMRESSSAFIA